MAVGVRKLFASDIGLATTGYAEAWPEGGIEKPFAWFAIDIAGSVESEKFGPLDGNRIAVQQSVAQAVLKKIIQAL